MKLRKRKYITLRWLREKGACLESRYEFKELFPSGKAELTEDNVIRWVRRTGSRMDLVCLAVYLGIDSDDADTAVFYSARTRHVYCAAAHAFWKLLKKEGAV